MTYTFKLHYKDGEQDFHSEIIPEEDAVSLHFLSVPLVLTASWMGEHREEMIPPSGSVHRLAWNGLNL